MAIVGLDGLPRGPQLKPGLTTVVQPVADVGQAAVDLLAGDAEPPSLVMLLTTLRIGASCGSSLS